MKGINKLISLLQKPSFICLVYVVVALVATLLRIQFDFQPGIKAGSIEQINASEINNYTIYCNSFYHLIHHITLYGYFNKEQLDQYLYSPSFPFIIMPFVILPKYIGVVLWCIFNALALFFAVRVLNIDEKKKVFIHWFVFLEMLTSIQNIQVNPLVAALFIFAFAAFESKKIGLAAFIIVVSLFIKVFGIVGASMFFFYPHRLKFIGYFIFWSGVIFLLPLFFISFDELLNQYKGWYTAIISYHSDDINDRLSAMQLLAVNLHFQLNDVGRYAIQIVAVIIFCIKYIRYKLFNNAQFKLLFLSTILIWSTIFNNAVESPSFVIAATGIALWYIADDKSKFNTALMIFAFVFTCLSPTDLFPRYVRETFIVPYVLKCLPSFIIWLKIEYELVFRKRNLLAQSINA